MRFALALVGLSLCASLAVPARAAPAKAAPSVTKTFSAWTATCDNLRDCVAIGSSDDGDALFYVRIARGAAAEAAPRVKVVLAATDPISGSPGVIQLSVGSVRAMADRFVVEVKKDDPDGAAIAGDVADPAFLFAIEQADTLDYAAGTLKGRLVLKGLAPALHFTDDQQGRSGTPTALVAPGKARFDPAPSSAPPDVTAAASAAVPVAAPTLSRALLDMAKPACDPDTVEAHSDAAAWTLGADRQLVAVPCAEGTYNTSVALFTTDAKGGKPRPAMLEQPPKQGDAEADNVVVNYDFDVKTLTLTSLDKGRGLGDCGVTRSWVWTGEIFALLRAAELEACPGALPEDWPPVFQARRK